VIPVGPGHIALAGIEAERDDVHGTLRHRLVDVLVVADKARPVEIPGDGLARSSPAHDRAQTGQIGPDLFVAEGGVLHVGVVGQAAFAEPLIEPLLRRGQAGVRAQLPVVRVARLVDELDDGQDGIVGVADPGVAVRTGQKGADVVLRLAHECLVENPLLALGTHQERVRAVLGVHLIEEGEINVDPGLGAAVHGVVEHVEVNAVADRAIAIGEVGRQQMQASNAGAQFLQLRDVPVRDLLQGRRFEGDAAVPHAVEILPGQGGLEVGPPQGHLAAVRVDQHAIAALDGAQRQGGTHRLRHDAREIHFLAFRLLEGEGLAERFGHLGQADDADVVEKAGSGHPRVELALRPREPLQADLLAGAGGEEEAHLGPFTARIRADLGQDRPVHGHDREHGVELALGAHPGADLVEGGRFHREDLVEVDVLVARVGLTVADAPRAVPTCPGDDGECRVRRIAVDKGGPAVRRGARRDLQGGCLEVAIENHRVRRLRPGPRQTEQNRQTEEQRGQLHGGTRSLGGNWDS